MEIKDFTIKTTRASYARFGASLRPWVAVLEVLAALLLLGGVVLVMFGYPIGWVAISVAILPAMMSEWYHAGLVQLAPTKKPQSISDILDGDVLGLLGDRPSPYDIAQATARVTAGHFFSVRFGLSGNFLQQLVSTNPDDTQAVWEEALRLKQTFNSPTITAGMLTVALVRQLPEEVSLLAHLQLDDDDVLKGIEWQQNIDKLVEHHSSQPKHPGGIGRDLTFGWIPMLSRYGRNLSENLNGTIGQVDLEAHVDALEQLVHSFEKHNGSMALVGPTGVGKTEIVYALAERLMNPPESLPDSLKFHQVFLLDASSLVSAAPGRGELEALVSNILGEAYAAKNIVVALDNAHLFFEEGVGSVDISTVLLPILQAGRLPIVLTIDEQRFLQISERNPELAHALNRINVGQATSEETMRVMQDQLVHIEYRNHVTYMYQALKEAYRLSERYVYDLAMPGRALKLLESSAQYSELGLVTAKSVQQAVEKTLNVKISAVDDDAERDKLLNMEALIHERMIGQSKAVSVVSDALRRARAGVRNQARPIGTFLFLGPTGVGKTELAKSLAAVYFGDESQIIRMDMNEFVMSSDVSRLIADGAKDPGSLTASVMKQPFSVILLDEIEKAHSSVLTTLLQLLDEGILRDENNREVSFRDAIVIATSNAGADRIREYIDRGYSLEQFETKLVDELIDSNIFHPEFLNRFDEIIVFSPLSKDELMQVVDIILVGVNKTLANQKVKVSVSEDAKKYLVDAAYDPRLGARPMRRVVQRAVENVAAKQVLSKSVEAGGTVEVSLDQVKEIVSSKKEADDIIASADQAKAE